MAWHRYWVITLKFWTLSKVSQAIKRFSEDIDATIDYQSLVAEMPNLEALPTHEFAVAQRNSQP